MGPSATLVLGPELVILFVEPQLEVGRVLPSGQMRCLHRTLFTGVWKSSLSGLQPSQVSAGERGTPRGGSFQLRVSSRAWKWEEVEGQGQT